MRRMALTLAALCILAGVGQAAAADECVIKVARVVPVTGPLLDLGREAPWVDEHKVKPINAAGGLQVGNKKCRIDFTIYDFERHGRRFWRSCHAGHSQGQG